MSKGVKVGGSIVAVMVVGMGVLVGLPNTMHIERTLVIDAPAAVVYAQVIDVEKAQGWSPWKAADDSMQIAMGDITEGIGASYAWTSQGQGGGELTVAKAVEFTSIENTLDFQDNGGGVGGWTFAEAGGVTTTTWTMDGEAPGLFGGLFALMADSMVGPMFEDGLQRLKAQAEAVPKPKPVVAPEVEEGADGEPSEAEAAEGEGSEAAAPAG
jgi:hypothetical protein